VAACSPTLTECPRCRNDASKCDGAFSPQPTPAVPQPELNTNDMFGQMPRVAQPEAPDEPSVVTEDAARSAFWASYPDGDSERAEIWMTAFRWSRLKIATPAASSREAVELSDEFALARAEVDAWPKHIRDAARMVSILAPSAEDRRAIAQALLKASQEKAS
jgi:hypothetical protein